MISPAAAELIRRTKTQLESGIQCVQREEPLVAEVWFRSAFATLGTLHALLDEPDRKPMRKMALVVMPREPDGAA